MNDAKFVDVQSVVKDILVGMKIATVISIDDSYVSSEELYTTLLSFLVEARKDGRIGLVTAYIPNDIVDTKSDEIFIRRIRTYWDELAEVAQRDLVSRLTDIGITSADRASLTLLGRMIPEEITFHAFTPAEWHQNRQEMLATAEPDRRLLCLFDQNLRLANLPETGGVTLLKETVASKSPYVICALLTQVVRSSDEMSQLRALAQSNDLRLDEFLPISKDRLQNGPEDFADGLKLLWLNSLREQLTKELYRISSAAEEVARNQLNELDINDFDYVVLRSSEREGLWEVQTLIRLHTILRSQYIQKVIHQTKRLDFISVANQIRIIRDINIVKPSKEIPSAHVYQLRTTELFEPSEMINPSHKPLEVGDIFLVGSNKYYILVSQSCDMMIRQDGKRRNKTGTLLRIKLSNEWSGLSRREQTAASTDRLDSAASNQSFTLPQDNQSLFQYELNYFGDFLGQHNTSYTVKFRDAYRISLNVLDLAVYTGDGTCKFPPPSSVEDLLHISLRNRLKILSQNWQKEVKELESIGYDKLQPYTQRAIRYRLALIDDIEDFTFQFSRNSDSRLEFNIQRIGRLREPGCIRLLDRFTHFLARPADEHDFAVAAD